MAYEIKDTTPMPRRKKQFIYKLPDITGKFGLSFNLGNKELFIGVAIAKIEMETVVKRRQLKVLKRKGTSTFIPFS